MTVVSCYKEASPSGLVFSVRAATMPDFHEENPNLYDLLFQESLGAGVILQELFSVLYPNSSERECLTAPSDPQTVLTHTLHLLVML